MKIAIAIAGAAVAAHATTRAPFGEWRTPRP